MHIKRIQAPVIAGLLVLMLMLPQLALAAGPEISDVDAVDITATTAAITWITNNLSDSEVKYGTTTILSNTESDSNMVIDHYMPLTGLAPDTLYYYAVWSDGVRSPAANDEYHSFTTTKLPAEYSITLDHACGVCGDLVEAGVCGELIGVTAIVAAPGTYHICWDSRTEANVVETFTATAPGIHNLVFFMPEATKGSHNVYLVNNTYADPATNTFDTFEVLPSVKTDLSEGPVGTEVTLNGYGFSNGQDIRVTLYQGGVKKGEEKTADANNNGSWTLPYTIPSTPRGNYILKVEAKEGTIWVGWVNKDFEVTPKITAPSSGKVGQTIRVQGTGFGSEEEDIQVTFDDEVRREDVRANANGSWSADIKVPVCTTRGDHDVGASGKMTRGRDVDPVTFTLVAGITVDPPSGYVGDTITVTGGGFTPGETGIKVKLGTTVVNTAPIPVDTCGCWEYSFALPASVYGLHDVSASGETTTEVKDTLTTKAKIVEYSPHEGPRGDTVSLTGSGFRGSQTLTMTVGGVAATESPQTRSNGDVVISFPVPRCTLGEQTLRVTDGEATAEVDFTVTEKVLATPLRISPEDSKLRSGTVTFSWHSITGGNGITYVVEVSNDSAFRSGLVSEPAGGTAELSYTLPNDKALGNGNYYWRVKAVDNYGNESEFSDSDYSTFTVSLIPIWVWVVVGIVVLVVLMVVAYRETKFKVTE